jgi:hypothetical protein
MPLFHQLIQYNVSYPSFNVAQGNPIFPVQDNQLRYLDFGVVNPVGTGSSSYPTITMGLRFFGAGNASDIKIWLDSPYADLFPRPGFNTAPMLSNLIFSISDNTNYFQIRYLNLNNTSSTDYNTFKNATTAASSGGLIMPTQKENAIGLGTVRQYLDKNDIHRDYFYSPVLAVRIFAPTNSPAPFSRWEVRNCRFRISYDNIL